LCAKSFDDLQYGGVLEMFNTKSADNTEENRKITESNLLDSLCKLAIERHFQNYFKIVPKHHFCEETNDRITLNICEALVKDLENEIWQRVGPKMLERVVKMKELAMEASGGHRLV
jgi:hypothetical protein